MSLIIGATPQSTSFRAGLKVRHDDALQSGLSPRIVAALRRHDAAGDQDSYISDDEVAKLNEKDQDAYYEFWGAFVTAQAADAKQRLHSEGSKVVAQLDRYMGSLMVSPFVPVEVTKAAVDAVQFLGSIQDMLTPGSSAFKDIQRAIDKSTAAFLPTTTPGELAEVLKAIANAIKEANAHIVIVRNEVQLRTNPGV